jgi:cell division protein FtsB
VPEAEIKKIQKSSRLSLKLILISILTLLLLSTYLGIILFGKNSLTVLMQLRDEKKSLTQEAVELKSSNQKLQKEFFELKNLEPKEEYKK